MNLAQLIAMIAGQPWMLSERFIEAVVSIAGTMGMVVKPALDTTVDVRSLRPQGFGSPMALSGGSKVGDTGRVARVGNTAVVDVYGVLAKDTYYADTTYAQVRQGVADAMNLWRAGRQGASAGQNASGGAAPVRHIVLRADSPGGEAIPVETAAAEIFAACREMEAAGTGDQFITMVEGLNCSAMYYLSSQTMAIFSSKGSATGSIGTRMSFTNWTGLLDKLGIKVETIKSTVIKDAGSGTRPMTDKDRAVLQAEVDAFDRQFVEAVMRGRGVDEATVRSWQAFRIKTGPEAVAIGLIDGVVNSCEQLVAMLNTPGGSDKLAAMRKRGPAMVAGAPVVVVKADATQTNQAPALAAAASAGDPAEGNVARLIGIAAIAAGVCGMNLDVDPPGAGGGGGGAATLTEGERLNIANAAKEQAKAEERQRVNKIRAAAIPFGSNEAIVKLSNRMIDEGGTVEAFNAEAMKSLAPKPLGGAPDSGAATGSPAIGSGDPERERGKCDAIAMGMMLRHKPELVATLRRGASASTGTRQAEDATSLSREWGYGSPADALRSIEASRKDGFAGMSMKELALHCVCQHANIDMAQAMRRYADPQELFRAAAGTRRLDPFAAQAGVSSSDFPGLMLNVANKVMMAAFALKPVVWNRICRRGTANDFKTAYIVGVSEIGKFAVLPEGAPIPETRPAERKETIAVLKYGNGFGLTFEAMVNDDLGAFANIPMMVGETAKYIPDDLLIASLKSNSYAGPVMATDSVNLFDAAHGNVTTGAFSYDNVRKTQLLGLQQSSRGPDQLELDIELSVLLVPTALKQAAEDLNTQLYVPGTAGQQNQMNTLRGTLDIPYSNKLASSVRFWMFTRPGPNSVYEVRHLFGQETPTIAISNQSDLSAIRYEAMVPGVGLAAASWEGAAASTGA